MRSWVHRGGSEVDDVVVGGWWLRLELGIVVNLLKSGSRARKGGSCGDHRVLGSALRCDVTFGFLQCLTRTKTVLQFCFVLFFYFFGTD